MVPFYKLTGLPSQYKRWQPTVDAMLEGITHTGLIYLMVDQAVVRPGEYHRRSGIHVDGNWIGAASDPKKPPPDGPGRWKQAPLPDPGWKIPLHSHAGGEHKGHKQGMYKPELLLLASDVQACRAYLGAFDAQPGEGGDCSHFNLKEAQQLDLEPNRVYLGNATTLHETLPVQSECQRTMVRLNIPLER